MSRIPERPDYVGVLEVSDLVADPTSGMEVHDIIIDSEQVRQDHVILDGRSFLNTNCHSKIGNLL